MNKPGFITTLLVDQTPGEVFNAVNNVRGWWSEEIDGHTDQLNEAFNYQYEDFHHCTIKVTHLEPGKKVVWLVLNNYFKFTKDKTEWTNTQIIFEIFEKDGKTGLQFTHEGLVPAYECFDICRDAWTNYIQNSLGQLIGNGKGMPNSKGNPQTENEKKLAASRD